MQTQVSRRGQTVVPSAIRERYGIKHGGKLEWLDTGKGIRVVPIPADPIEALHGAGRGEGLVKTLLEERRKEREREQPQEKRNG